MIRTHLAQNAAEANDARISLRKARVRLCRLPSSKHQASSFFKAIDVRAYVQGYRVLCRMLFTRVDHSICSLLIQQISGGIPEIEACLTVTSSFKAFSRT
jgi:hypothetical protein